MKKIFAFAALAVATFAGAAFAAEGYSIAARGGSGKVNTPITSTITVTTTGDYHVNKEYPHKVLLTAPDGATVESAKVMGVVASETSLTFTFVSTLAAAGTKGIGGEVKFATCTATSCIPSVEKVTVNVTAE
jgi:hypothetical protein